MEIKGIGNGITDKLKTGQTSATGAPLTAGQTDKAGQEKPQGFMEGLPKNFTDSLVPSEEAQEDGLMNNYQQLADKYLGDNGINKDQQKSDVDKLIQAAQNPQPLQVPESKKPDMTGPAIADALGKLLGGGDKGKGGGSPSGGAGG